MAFHGGFQRGGFISCTDRSFTSPGIGSVLEREAPTRSVVGRSLRLLPGSILGLPVGGASSEEQFLQTPDLGSSALQVPARRRATKVVSSKKGSGTNTPLKCFSPTS